MTNSIMGGERERERVCTKYRNPVTQTYNFCCCDRDFN